MCDSCIGDTPSRIERRTATAKPQLSHWVHRPDGVLTRSTIRTEGDSMGIEFRLLGRLEVLSDGVAVDLGSQRQRALLALLLANAGTVLSTDRILDELWGDAGGADKQNSLWVYVSGLRGALEPERAKRSEGTVLLTRSPGYVMAINPADLDVGRFEQCVAEARLIAETDPASAAAALRDGLALWRGHAFEEFAYEGWAQA